MSAKYFETRPGTLVCGASGKQFVYPYSSANARKKAVAELEAHQREYLKSRHPVEHREDRDPATLRQLRTQQQSPLQRSGLPSESYDPGDQLWRAELGRHNPLWQDTPAARRMKKRCKEISAQHAAKKQAEADRAEHEAAVADLVSWAEKNREWVHGDGDATVEDTERADQILDLCRQGRRDEAVTLDREYREKVLQRTAEKMGAIESQRQSLASEIEKIKTNAVEALGAIKEVPEVAAPSPAPVVDRSKAAVVRRVPAGNGYREVTEIVDV